MTDSAVGDSAFSRIQGVPRLLELYDALCGELDKLGPYQIQYKKSALHVTAGAVFLAVQPRGHDGLQLTIITDRVLQSARLRRAEQRSELLAHNEVLVSSIQDFDAELIGWLRLAHSQVSA